MELMQIGKERLAALTKFVLSSKNGHKGEKDGASAFVSSLKSMFACEETLKILPSLAEFEEVAKKLASGKECTTLFCWLPSEWGQDRNSPLD